MMLQDIFPHKLYNQFEPSAVPKAEDNVLIFDGRSVLSDISGEGVRFPSVADIGTKENLIFLFRVDENDFYLGTRELAEKLKGFEYNDLKSIREAELSPKYNVFAAYTGKHLADWYRDMKYCGRCGNIMTHSKTERAMTCSCGYTAYPRIMPAVIVGVRNKDKLLLTRYRTGYNHNALIAGFTEIGETLEETVSREVMEEAGISVKNITYYKSQPWGVAGDILAGYVCDVDGDDTIHMDANELKTAIWTKREDIELQPDESSLTNEIMKMFKEGKL